MAEVKPDYVTGAYVSCQEALAAFQAQKPGVSVVINSHLFFR
jgi:hypothetical protein